MLLNAVNNAMENKPELTCISEEGIADMDFPPDLFDGFDFGNDENDEDDDIITSCNKVKYSLSEIENGNSTLAVGMEGKKRRNSLIRKQQLSLLAAQVIPEISHEDDEVMKNGDAQVLSNGHTLNCNINRNLRSENNFNIPPCSKFPIAKPNRVISVIEEAAV